MMMKAKDDCVSLFSQIKNIGREEEASARPSYYTKVMPLR